MINQPQDLLYPIWIKTKATLEKLLIAEIDSVHDFTKWLVKINHLISVFEEEGKTRHNSMSKDAFNKRSSYLYHSYIRFIQPELNCIRNRQNEKIASLLFDKKILNTHDDVLPKLLLYSFNDVHLQILSAREFMFQQPIEVSNQSFVKNEVKLFFKNYLNYKIEIMERKRVYFLTIEQIEPAAKKIILKYW